MVQERHLVVFSQIQTHVVSDRYYFYYCHFALKIIIPHLLISLENTYLIFTNLALLNVRTIAANTPNIVLALIEFKILLEMLYRLGTARS